MTRLWWELHAGLCSALLTSLWVQQTARDIERIVKPEAGESVAAPASERPRLRIVGGSEIRREDTEFYGSCVVDQSSLRCTCETCSPGDSWREKAKAHW